MNETALPATNEGTSEWEVARLSASLAELSGMLVGVRPSSESVEPAGLKPAGAGFLAESFESEREEDPETTAAAEPEPAVQQSTAQSLFANFDQG